MDLASTLTLNQLGEYIIDCNACLIFDEAKHCLYVINYDEKLSQYPYTAHVFKYQGGNIYYGTGSAKLVENTFTFQFPVAADKLLAENVSSFSVTPVIVSTDTHISSATVSIAFANSVVTYDAKRTIALRNKPPLGTLVNGKLQLIA